MNRKMDRLQREAFSKIELSAEWIIELAGTGQFSDKYTRSLCDDKYNGVMPIAETLMCLTNLSEYKQLGVPQPPDSLFAEMTKLLISTIKEKGFSGAPYLYGTEEQEPPFTDAVCFTAGALTGVLSRPFLNPELRQSAIDALLSCTRWLLGARITPPHELGLSGAGWSWSSPSVIDADDVLKSRFKDLLPPQTYFTSSAIITLCEILFDLPEEVKKAGLQQDVFQSIVDGKVFLLATLIQESRLVGWADFGGGLDNDPEKIQKLTSLPVAAWESLQGGGMIEPLGEFTLYGLEPLTYIRYYDSDESYADVVSVLKANFADLYREFCHFSDQELESLEEAFLTSQFLLRHRTISRKTSRVQVPSQLNSREGQKFSYYIDGTVGFQGLNVLNFYVRYFAGAEESRQTWNDNQVTLVEQLLGNSFKDRSFAHCGDPVSGGIFDPAIYATRTAVASLLSWGARPALKQDEAIPSDVREVIKQLYLMVGGVEERVTDVSEAEAECRTALSTNALAQLLDIGFNVGLFLGLLRNIDNVPRQQLLVDITKGGVCDVQVLLKENGHKAVDFLCKMLTFEPEKTSELIEQLCAQRGLARPYREFLESNKERITHAQFNDRLGVLREMVDSVKDKVVEAGDTRFGELCDGN